MFELYGLLKLESFYMLDHAVKITRLNSNLSLVAFYHKISSVKRFTHGICKYDLGISRTHYNTLFPLYEL